MVLKIRFGKGSKVGLGVRKNRRLAAVIAALLAPAGALALVLAMWRVAADLHWANRFVFASGLLSHWQVWLAAAGLLQACSSLLNRYGQGGDAATS